MTWPHADPELTAERLRELAQREHKCRSCLYGGWGPGLAERCLHPGHKCWDAARLTMAALGCADRVSRYDKLGPDDPTPVPPVCFAEYHDRRHCERLAARRGEPMKEAA
jgi:hypothetical protein